MGGALQARKMAVKIARRRSSSALKNGDNGGGFK